MKSRLDWLWMAGLALIAIGCGLIYVPLGLIAGGVACIAVALVAARSEALAAETSTARKDEA